MSTSPTAHYVRVRDFMVKAKQDCPTTPTAPTPMVCELRARLIMEEALETIKALGVTIWPSESMIETVRDSMANGAEITFEDFEFEANSEPNLVGIADGCADVKVVTTGTLIACGIIDRPVQDAVDENNLAKFAPGHSWRDDGKLIKPPGHTPPDLGAVLRAQGWKG